MFTMLRRNDSFPRKPSNELRLAPKTARTTCGNQRVAEAHPRRGSTWTVHHTTPEQTAPPEQPARTYTAPWFRFVPSEPKFAIYIR
jgi:hypothetical protein